MSVGLPAGWVATSLIPGSRFDAASGALHLNVTTGPFPAPFQYFAKTEKIAARAHYRAEDPKASVRSHVVTLPSGPAVLTTVTLTHGAPLAIYIYALLHNNVTYHFTYFTSQSQAASERPSFAASAGSIKFTK